MTAGQPFVCSSCGSKETIGEDLFNEIERMFIAQVRAEIVAAGGRAPGDHALRYLRAHGRWASQEELRDDWRTATRVPNAPGVVEHETFALGGADKHQAVIVEIGENGPVEIVADETKPGALIVRLPTGPVIGHITPRHPVAKSLAEGNTVLFAAINSINQAKCGLLPRLRVATGPAGTVWTPWVSEPPTRYPVGLVGEKNYQRAIRRCGEGDDAELLYEPDNPYDSGAIVAVSDTGETIGYIPRGNWLRKALAQGKGCSATIKSIDDGDAGLLGVVLEVELCAGELGTREFERR